MKICTKCCKEKSNFRNRTKSKDGLSSWCADCFKSYDKERYKTLDKTKKNNQQKVRRQNNRSKIIEFLKLASCMDCGIGDWRVLEFDHKDPKTKKFNIADSVCLSFDSIQNEISKCDIVCANCHRIRTITQQNYYCFD